MQIPINQFEQYIDETILKKGLSYFKKGYVSEPEEITAGVYEATVAGTEDYTVKLKIKNNTIVEHVCSCPYDMGPVCKHVAAVLFYLQQDVLELIPKAIPLHNTKEKTTTKKVKKKTVSEQVDEVLEKITHHELKQFIREKAEHNPPFRNIFLSSFAHQNTNESKEHYSKQVKSILRTAMGRNGFIYWNQVRSVDKQVNELLNTAQKQSENKNFRSAIFIYTAVMEEMTEALQFADDSNGDIGGNIDFAFESLSNISKEKLPEEIRTQLFEYCVSAFEKRIYADWEWHIGVLKIASGILMNEEEAQRITTCLDEVQQSEYEKEEAQIIKLSIIRKTKGEMEVEKFIEQNLSNPNLRREAIQKALRDKSYDKAIRISKDGIKQDEKNKPGLAIEWYDWLLKTAQAQNDIEKIIEYARLLFIDNFRHEQDYYQLLKNIVQPEMWHSFVEGIIKDITTKKQWLDFDLIAKIYVKEEWWNRLLGLIKQKPSFNYIEHYEKHLSKDFSEELVMLYGNEVVQYIKNSTGRNHYQTACKYLRRMIKLGGREMVEQIVSDFREQYPQRKALMEELNRI
ncbi:MAG: SWIM zinc finger domain-containing protein [Gammaproteobacteria bacterium]